MIPRGALVVCRVAVGLVVWALDGVADEPASVETPASRIFREFSPAVVRVKVATQEAEAAGQTTVLVGSGFFIGREGRVLTMFDASSPVSRIWVEKDGVESLAEVIGADARTNIQLLQVVRLPENFAVIPVEPQETALPLASPVLAISNPYAFETSPTLGLATGYESFVGDNVFPCTFLRVNIPTYEGENGSPVLDLEGHLAGMAVGSIPEIRSSYLVPTRALARIVDELARQGRVDYATLPVRFGEFPDGANLRRQVMVEQVFPDSSAARAGLRSGDVVRRLAGSPVRRIHDVRDALFYASPGEFIQMEIEREGRVIPFALPLETAPRAVANGGRPARDRTPAGPPAGT